MIWNIIEGALPLDGRYSALKQKLGTESDKCATD